MPKHFNVNSFDEILLLFFCTKRLIFDGSLQLSLLSQDDLILFLFRSCLTNRLDQVMHFFSQLLIVAHILLQNSPFDLLCLLFNKFLILFSSLFIPNFILPFSIQIFPFDFKPCVRQYSSRFIFFSFLFSPYKVFSINF